MGKRLITLFLMVTMLFGSSVFASTSDYGNVKDNNNGNKGYIFINSGVVQGQKDDVGTWVDPSCVPELKGEQGEKGDKGDKGDTGLQGIPGANGSDGEDGINGVNGNDGQNGTDGQDGINGTSGQDGVKGDVGEIGPQGNKGDIGEKGKDVDPAVVNSLQNINTQQDQKINRLEDRVSALEETQYQIIGEVRVLDTKKWTVSPFVSYNIGRNKVDIVGVRVTFKFGQSYEERKIAELEAKVNALLAK